MTTPHKLVKLEGVSYFMENVGPEITLCTVGNQVTEVKGPYLMGYDWRDYKALVSQLKMPGLNQKAFKVTVGTKVEKRTSVGVSYDDFGEIVYKDDEFIVGSVTARIRKEWHVENITVVMSDHLVAWIRRVATLNDTALEEELNLINKNSLNAFARAISRTRRPELDSHIHRSGAYEAHPHADTINLLFSVGEAALSAINSDTPVSPVPYAVSPHMDISARIKVLTRRTVIYKSELPTNNRTNGLTDQCQSTCKLGNSLDKTFSLLKVAF
ncbi:hypothetical protein BDEG_26296 [Batrachochytrium dendrobatidis JEL423]|uniref:Uncharacterized protein n=1 Tax=Batrachochytrium dendrobatidis (strain JEL423) TaxID=403673 RepID=A0A177WTC9_BATDL|nr:hypothetical protein BDEG_26296 [Batrachochytrium dendrobatidis JEL423]